MKKFSERMWKRILNNLFSIIYTYVAKKLYQLLKREHLPNYF